MDESQIFKRLQWNLKSEVVKNLSTVKTNIANPIQNIPTTTISFHTICENWVFTQYVKTDCSGYRQLAGSQIYCYANSLLSLKVSWTLDSCMLMEHFHMHDDSKIDIWSSEQFFGMTNSNSTHDKNIAHGSGPDMVKSTIVHCVFTVQ